MSDHRDRLRMEQKLELLYVARNHQWMEDAGPVEPIFRKAGNGGCGTNRTV